jgi:hypothetical protein
MDRQIIGLLIVIFIAVVAVSGCIENEVNEDYTIFENETNENSIKLESYEDENISFKFPHTFTPNHLSDTILFFDDYEKDETIGVIIGKNSLTLDQMYENLERRSKADNNIKNFTMEKIDFNGIPAIKKINEINYGQYEIFLTFKQSENSYQFSMQGSNLESLESLYELIKSNIVLK